MLNLAKVAVEAVIQVSCQLRRAASTADLFCLACLIFLFFFFLIFVFLKKGRKKEEPSSYFLAFLSSARVPGVSPLRGFECTAHCALQQRHPICHPPRLPSKSAELANSLQVACQHQPVRCPIRVGRPTETSRPDSYRRRPSGDTKLLHHMSWLPGAESQHRHPSY